jgi:predicted ABC-type transport system involved in lysophospholipase L1 biosynthesis ATPase subunit
MSLAGGGGSLVEVWGLTHAYPTSGEELVALKDVELNLADGERLAIVGPSGSGKSVLLRVLAGLEKPRSGRVRVAGYDLLTLDGGERADYRRHVSYLGHRAETVLWPALTAEENVQLSVAASGRAEASSGPGVRDLLTAVGLAGRDSWHPARLTLGERRRLAFAVGLVTQPRLLLADDPVTGLDIDGAEELRACIDDVLRQWGTSMILATRNHRAAPQVNWVMELPAARTLPVDATAGRPPRRGSNQGRSMVLDVRGVRVGSPRRDQPAALSDVSFQVGEAELVAVVGGSSAERSVLLALCGGRQRPDAGLVLIAGNLEEDAWCKVGWVVQESTPSSLTVAEHVAFAARIAGASQRESASLARMVLKATGLEHHASTPVNHLSTWEERCVTLARALARVPVLVIADEPTAGLDTQAAAAILAMLREVADSGVAVLLGTNETAIARVADRVLTLADGGVREVEPRE